MYFFKTPAVQKHLFPGLVWDFPESSNNLYLTFDDGPDDEATSFVLEILQQYHAKATFFLVGKNIVDHPGQIRELMRHGHAVGNHTYSHVNGWKVESDYYLEEVRKCQEVLAQHSIKPTLFRAPYGRPNYHSLKELKKDYRVIMWSHLSGDFDPDLDISKANAALKTARPGSILLFHTSKKAFRNLKILLPETLDYFSGLGYSFEKIT